MNEININLALTQQKVTQKMIQSAEILQMDSQALEAYMEKLLLENPLIELSDNHLADKAEKTALKERTVISDEKNRIYYKKDYESNDRWDVSSSEEDLYAYVMSQLIYDIHTQKEREIIEYFVYSLNEKGYLETTAAEADEVFQLSPKQYEAYVKILQSAEPAGIGARDLKECLLLQLDRIPSLPIEREKINQVIALGIEEIGKNHIKEIAARLAMTVQEISTCIKLIRKLNPKPANGFYLRENLRYIQPEVIVVKFKDYFEVFVGENTYPEIRMNHDYIKMLQENHEPEVIEYIKEKKRQAEWMRECIFQRNKTLVDVTKAILQYQSSFFETQKGFLRPLRMMDIAERLKIHESTVSRAVKNKYLQCARGIYPLNYFFVRPVGSENISTTKAKDLLKEIIDNEDKHCPISDQKIESVMRQRGITISRRTIAKYRQAMGICNAEGRKQY